MAEKKGFNIASALSSVSNLNTEAQSRQQLEYINIDFIDPDPANRKFEGVKELAQNISLVGLQQPLAVRPNPEREDRYIVVSGHRRREAIILLVSEGEEKYRMVPCLVSTSQKSAALQRLELLSGNIVTETLTPAQMAQAAKEVEDCIYQLKEEGHEFPGRIRDYVAETCKVSASKLAKLKVIRENLVEELKPAWEDGSLKEIVAYVFAKHAPDVQLLMIKQITGYGQTNTERKWWTEDEAKRASENVTREMRPRKGPKGTCEQCDATENRLRRLGVGHQWGDHCSNGKCCHDCPNLGHCEYACPHLAGEVAKVRAAEKEKRVADKEAKRKAEEPHLVPKIRLWKRFGEARSAAGLTFEEYAERAHIRYFRREKKVGLFEQGEQITMSSGGLPYCDGDGFDDYRIKPLIRAADALGVSLDYLLCRTDEPKGGAGAKVAVSGSWTSAATPPPKNSNILADFDIGDGSSPVKLYRTDCLFDGTNYRLNSGAKIDIPPIRWLLIPPVEEPDK